MNVSEQVNVNGSRIPITEAIIEQVNRSNPTVNYTLADKATLLVGEAVLIDDQPTANGNIYDRSFQNSMQDKWTGTPLVYSEDDHKPNAPDHVGWIFNAEVRSVGKRTQTIGQLVIPKIAENGRLVERLSNGLNKSVSISVEVSKAVCEECKKPLDLARGRCGEHPQGMRRMLEGSRAIHLALVGDSASPVARITRLSESMRVDETAEPQRQLSERQQMLLTEAERLRAPMLAEAVKYARLINPKIEPEALMTRLDKWTVEEIATFKDVHREMYERTNPNANKQLSKAVPMSEPSGGIRSTEQPTSTHWKSLDEIMRDVKPINAERSQLGSN